MLSSLQQDLKVAMKSGQKDRVTALRNVIAKLRAKQIEVGSDLSESDVLKVLQSYAKQLKDAIQQYENAGRQDLVEKESAELTVLEEYLPVALTESEIKSIVLSAISKTGASSMADMGKVMPIVMKKVAGRGDGKIAQQIVREHLA